MKFIFFVLLMLFTVTTVKSSETIAINQPYPYQPIAPGKSVLFQYTVIGMNAGITFDANTTYPNYLNVDFFWSSNNSQILNIHTHTQLSTRAYAHPSDNQTHHAKWEMPSRSFFKRYSPDVYKFSFMFYEIFEKKTSKPGYTTKSIGNTMVVPISITM